jgi:hypothetical protein
MPKLLDANGRPYKVERDPPALNSPDREVLRVLRIVETAYRTGLPELCATLDETRQAGWSLTIDSAVPESRAEITIMSHLTRDADNKLCHKPERWVRLGSGYTEALTLIKAEAEKAACVGSA